MSMNLVNLNTNPCKMCMPMGSASALCGIKKCMTILHGSQGCSTYIRRHMAEHYNEPIDIASSSLTEEGTIFGGEKNLIMGLENLISLYSPQVIGIATTCLAETIGEDVEGIIQSFYEIHPDLKEKVKLIPVASSGYSGTQFEGFFRSLYAIVSHTEMKKEKNNKINIITPMISPADTRYLKKLLSDMKIDYILLPDLSQNLDGTHEKHYNRLMGGGTSLEEISMMGGARLTIELSTFADDSYSPAKYLFDKYDVPYVRCPLPCGLRDTDVFIGHLKSAGGLVTEEMETERGRFLDAMIDSHKHNAKGRAVIFGEPDFVYSLSRLCCENGIVPVLTATGSKVPALKEMLAEEIRQTAVRMFVDDFYILDDCDFDKIEYYTKELDANILIGNSDARRIEHKLSIPLVRCAFPIHDHIGGQRVRTLGYEGSLMLLDRITNTVLSKTEGNYREEMYEKYYTGEKKKEKPISASQEKVMSVAEKTKEHPCFNGCATNNARIHLPIAPKCNIQCNYCIRKYDCPNESRPGVTTEILSPAQALEKYLIVKEKVPNLSVVGIAGPGDSLANFDETRETLKKIREADPNVIFCLSTNGLMLPTYASEFVSLGISHVTVTINAVDPSIGAKIYKHIDYMGKRYTGEVGAALLMANQLSGLKLLRDYGIVCKVNIVMLKGINDTHIPEVVKTVKELGCIMTNIMQMIPVKGSGFENMPLTSNQEIMQMRKDCEVTLNQMYHCRQCRADAIGTLDDDRSIEFRGCGSDKPTLHEENTRQNKTELFAVSSKGGILVDQHFGHASDFYIYECNKKDDSCTIKFRERRSIDKYCSGIESCDGNGGGKKEGKIENILETIDDCACVITMRIGEAPRQKLAEKGIKIVETYDRIEDAVRKASNE